MIRENRLEWAEDALGREKEWLRGGHLEYKGDEIGGGRERSRRELLEKYLSTWVLMLKQPLQTSLFYRSPDTDKCLVLKGTLNYLFPFQIVFPTLSHCCCFPCCYKNVVRQLSINLKKWILLCCSVSLASLTLRRTFCNFLLKTKP